MEGSVVAMQEIVTFQQKGVSSEGKVVGEFKFTGIRPRFLDRLKTRGLLNGIHFSAFEEAMKNDSHH